MYAFADLLRGKNGVESRSAVLQTDRLDLIRGKDFARWCREHPELVASSKLVSKGEVYFVSCLSKWSTCVTCSSLHCLCR
jgi:hypothetical protein